MTDKPRRPATSGTRKGNGAGQGTGYGGPAKGCGNGNPKTSFNASTNAQGHNKATDPALLRAERRRERADRMEDILFEIAEGSERDGDRVQAAAKLHAICDGLPVARQVTTLQGEEGKPLGFVIYGVQEKASVEEWAQQHTPTNAR